MRIAPKVSLTAAQEQSLIDLSRGRSVPVRVAERAKILLLAAAGKTDKQIGRELALTRQTAARWRRRFLGSGIDGLLRDAPRGGRPRTIDDAKTSQIIALTTTGRPPGATHWSTRSMARHVGLSEASVRRVWKAHGLKPHRVKTFKVSNDPQFAAKLQDIVGLYLSPPEHAIVLSCDEKSQIQALDRTQPSLPMKKGRCGTMTHDYKRHGTTTLFAALNTLDGRVISTCMKRHRHQEWLKFLKLIDAQTPADRQLHLIADNYCTHKHPKVKNWLKRHPRFHMHFIPTSSSWLNLVERWFREITDKRIRRGAFRSVLELTDAIMAYIEAHNANPQSFEWTAKAEDIIEKVRRAREMLNKSASA